MLENNVWVLLLPSFFPSTKCQFGAVGNLLTWVCILSIFVVVGLRTESRALVQWSVSKTISILLISTAVPIIFYYSHARYFLSFICMGPFGSLAPNLKSCFFFDTDSLRLSCCCCSSWAQSPCLTCILLVKTELLYHIVRSRTGQVEPIVWPKHNNDPKKRSLVL